MTTKTQRQDALREYGKTRNIVLLQKRLRHKNIKSTLNLLVRSGALENAGGQA
jgi:CobQ-like glutamine amidotransferase family enzyme